MNECPASALCLMNRQWALYNGDDSVFPLSDIETIDRLNSQNG